MAEKVELVKDPRDLILKLRKGSNKDSDIIATIPSDNRKYLGLKEGYTVICKVIQIKQPKNTK